MRVIVPLILLVIAGCGAPKTPRAAQDRLPRVEMTTPAVESIPIAVELTATVEPLYRVDLCARVTGTVAEFLPPDLDIGSRVIAGTPVLRLEVPELEAQLSQRKALVGQAKNQVSQAMEAERVASREVTESESLLKRYVAEWKFRQLETKRIAELAVRGATQPERVEEARRQLESADAALEAARAAVETKKAKQNLAQADIATANSRLTVAEADAKATEELIALATVKAPPAGENRPEGRSADPDKNQATPATSYVVSRRHVDRGATVKDSAQPLLTLMCIDTVRVLIDVPERDVALLEAIVQEGMMVSRVPNRVTLRVPALRESPSRGEYQGRITRTAGVLDPATRTMRAEVEFDNRGAELRPGMYGTAVLNLGTRQNALILPSSAFVHREGRTEVLVVDRVPDSANRGKVRVVPVETGFDDGKRVQVTSGLSGTERVIVRGNTPLVSGDEVIMVEWRSR